MIPGTEITLSILADPHQSIGGRLLSIEGRCVSLALDHAPPLAAGTLVQFQTPDTLYLGETHGTSNGSGDVNVLIQHSVDLERAGAIRRVWNIGGVS